MQKDPSVCTNAPLYWNSREFPRKGRFRDGNSSDSREFHIDIANLHIYSTAAVESRGNAEDKSIFSVKLMEVWLFSSSVFLISDVGRSGFVLKAGDIYLFVVCSRDLGIVIRWS